VNGSTALNLGQISHGSPLTPRRQSRYIHRLAAIKLKRENENVNDENAIDRVSFRFDGDRVAGSIIRTCRVRRFFPFSRLERLEFSVHENRTEIARKSHGNRRALAKEILLFLLNDERSCRVYTLHDTD